MFESCVYVEPGEAVVLATYDRTARKQHRCAECREPILPGHKYVEERILFERKLSTCRTCLACFRIRQSLFRHGWEWGGMWEDIHGQFCGRDEDGDYVCICPRRERVR